MRIKYSVTVRYVAPNGYCRYDYFDLFGDFSC